MNLLKYQVSAQRIIATWYSRISAWKMKVFLRSEMNYQAYQARDSVLYIFSVAFTEKSEWLRAIEIM